MRLTKQTGYAIRILIDCARSDDELVKVASVAQRLDITLQNAFKIVNILTHTGFLAATRGRNGGIRLAKPATEIRIGEVVRATEATLIEVEAADGAGPDDNSGSINSLLDDALLAFISVLDQHTLADMARQTTATGKPAPKPRGPAKIVKPLAIRPLKSLRSPPKTRFT